MTEPRPYIVTVETTTGNVVEHVDAYDIPDAMMRAGVRLIARALTMVKCLDVAPDVEEVKRRNAIHAAEVEAAFRLSVRDSVWGHLVGKRSSSGR